MIEHALAYANRGWHVFPLAPGTKIPIKGSHGQNDATVNGAAILDLWSPYDCCTGERAEPNPPLNIGIATGPSNLVVIDIDVPKTPYKPGDKELFGIEAWAMMLTQAGLSSEPRTYEVETPSGGSHLYFEANEAFPVKTSASTLAPGIDVRAINGSITAAGSRTEKGEYVCIRDIKPKPLPSWLRGPLGRAGLSVTDVEVQARPAPKPVTSTSSYAKAAFDDEIAKLRQATEPGRNDKLNSAAWKLKKFTEERLHDGAIVPAELNAYEVADALFAAAIEIGLSDKEATTTIRSGLGV
jgi:hypothetical protein